MISTRVRRTLRTLYAFACGYCGVSETEVGAHLTIDHFRPQNAGGSDDVSNLVYACHTCNMHKSAAWNTQEAPVLHPLEADLTLHLSFKNDGTVEGLTPEGRRHIATLHLNRPPMVERRKMRRLLQALLEIEAQRLEQERKLDSEAQMKKRRIRRKRKP